MTDFEFEPLGRPAVLDIKELEEMHRREEEYRLRNKNFDVTSTPIQINISVRKEFTEKDFEDLFAKIKKHVTMQRNLSGGEAI